MTADEVVAVSGLGKRYGGPFRARSRSFALRDVSFTIRRGSIFALLGPNGAGKSTTIHVLLGFLAPTTGWVRILGDPPASPVSRRSLGFLPELFAFDRFATGRRLLEQFDAMAGLDVVTRRARVDEALGSTGLVEAAGRKVGTYSKGMSQRIGLAQALLGDPELVVLDEPMSGLDPAGRRLVKDLLLERRSRGRTTLLSSHILAEIEELADDVLILDRGRVVANAPLAELRRPSSVRRVVFKPLPPTRMDDALRQLLSRSRPTRDGQALAADFSDEAEMNAALALLVRAGGVIVSVDIRDIDLETLFLDLTTTGASDGRASS